MKCQTISPKYFSLSRVKITLFLTCEDIMFSRESSPGIALVFK